MYLISKCNHKMPSPTHILQAIFGKQISTTTLLHQIANN